MPLGNVAQLSAKYGHYLKPVKFDPLPKYAYTTGLWLVAQTQVLFEFFCLCPLSPAWDVIHGEPNRRTWLQIGGQENVLDASQSAIFLAGEFVSVEQILEETATHFARH